MKAYTEKDLQNMKKADLIALLQAQGQEVLQAMQDAMQAQDEKAQAQKDLQEITGLSTGRLQYEENKYNDSVTCFYNFPAVFAQDTVQYRAEHALYLQALGRKYIQEVLQNENRQAGKQAGRKARKAGTNKPAGTGRKAVDKTTNDVYRYIVSQVTTTDLQEADMYTTLKKEGKTVARIYVMRDNKVKALVKEDVAKKAGLAYTLMKFNLPASCILQNTEDADRLIKAF